jgi:hypothetical protein
MTKKVREPEVDLSPEATARLQKLQAKRSHPSASRATLRKAEESLKERQAAAAAKKQEARVREAQLA